MKSRCGCPSGLLPAAALFRSLGDPARLAIIRHLADGEAPGGRPDRRTGPGPVHRLQHLACLRDCGLVDARPAGRASVYSLRQPALLGLLEAAEAVLEATGNAVALCPNYGQAR